MNWSEAGKDLDVLPLVALLSVAAVVVSEGLYQVGRRTQSVWRSVWLYLGVGLADLVVVPLFVTTGRDPTNLVLTHGAIFLFPLTSFYLAIRIVRAKWPGPLKARAVPAVTVVGASWFLFALFWFFAYS